MSSSQVCESASVTKWGERNPRSNCIPSTTSTLVSACFPSSTVITPSLPTFRKASARTLPTVGSLLPAIVAICISSFLFFSLIGVAIATIAFETAATALWMPRDRAIGSAPAAIIFRPSRKIASARTVAVVVPSPATSLVLLAASLTSCAPRFSNGSSRSISSATVTPSFVTLGEPQPLSSTALRPRGPSVLLTARASLETPASRGWRASSSNTICLATSNSFGVRNDAWEFEKKDVSVLAVRSTDARHGSNPRAVNQGGCFSPGETRSISPGRPDRGDLRCRFGRGGPIRTYTARRPDHGAHEMVPSRPLTKSARRSAVRSASSSEIVSTAECM